MHGWGGDSNSWSSWANNFQGNGWIWQSAERGYGGKEPFTPNWYESAVKLSTQKRVVICHSLGLHLIDKNILSNSTHLILLNSFSRFIPQGKARRSFLIAMKGMKKALGTKEEANMLKNFIEKANLPHPMKASDNPLINNGPSFKGRQFLYDDLDLLINTNSLPTEIPLKSKLLIISGKKDAIVHPTVNQGLIKDLKEHLNNPITSWYLEEEGHSLFNYDLTPKIKDWLD